jgi:hypothetical protein
MGIHPESMLLIALTNQEKQKGLLRFSKVIANMLRQKCGFK